MSNRPRVSLVSHAYLEERYRGKLDYLAQNVNLTLVSPDEFPFPYGLYGADFPKERAYNVETFPCHFPLGLRTSTRWILASRDLGFRHSAPDVIHVENEAHSFSLLQALIWRRLYAPQAKVVVFVWANQRLKGTKGIVLTLLSRLMRPGIDFYIVGNTEGKTLLVECGVPAGRVAVFPSVGTDVNYYTPGSLEERMHLRREMGIAPDEFVIGFVGRLVVDKGIPDLVLAFRQLSEEAHGALPRLLCVGDGPLKPDLLALQPEVLVASPGGNGRVLPYYRVMDVLVLPSRTMPLWKEQFGLVLTEAMACGVPVIGSDSGSIPEVIGEAGFVFAEGHVPELTHCLRILMRSPEQRNLLAERGRRWASDKYADRQIARQTLAVYRDMLNLPGASPT